MDSMDMLMDLIALGSGIYCFYTWIRLLKEKRLFKNGLLVPREKRVEDCADEEAYIAYMRLPLAVLAVVTLAYGVVMTINDSLPQKFITYPWVFIPLALVMAALVWYAVRNGKANREYFGL